MPKTRKFRNHQKVLAAAMAASLSVMLTGPITGAGATARPAGTHSVASTATIKPDLDFYRGQTIAFYTPAVGTTVWQAVQYLLPVAESYLDATIDVVAIPVITTANNDVGEATPNGLTIGVGGIQTPLTGFYENNSVYDYSVLNTSNIAGMYQTDSLYAACDGAPFTTAQQMFASAAPVTNVENLTNLESAIASWMMFQAYGTPSKFIPGYSGSTQIPGCERGDGDIASSGLSVFENAGLTGITPGMTPLLLTSPIPKGSPIAYLNKTVPTLTEYLAKHPPKTAAGRREMAIAAQIVGGVGSTIFGPAGIDKRKVLALTDAFKAALQNPTVKSEFLRLGIPPGYINPDQIRPAFEYGIKKESLIRQYLARPTS